MFERFMQHAILLAQKGNGRVSPNPMVGAVLVYQNEIISEGWHQEFGGPHAEVMAINNWKGSLNGVTLVTTLEPCCHTNKKTPPCTELILKSGIKKVVIAALDPNPNVSGNGVKILKDAGIEVITGVLEQASWELNYAFLINQRHNRPYYHVKIAQTLNGMISDGIGKSTNISCPEVQTLVHKMRYEADAIMIGRGTLDIDNPLLTVRYHPQQLTKNLIKIIIGNPNKMNLDSRLFLDQSNNGKIILLVNNQEIIQPKILELLSSKNVNIMHYENTFQECNQMFLKMGIGKILVEPGAYLFGKLLESKTYDQITSFICPKFFKTGAQILSSEVINFNKTEIQTIGNNIMINYFSRAETCSLE